MIILDTNVVSEPLKPAPNPAVMDWLNAQEPETLYLTTINLAELLAGVELLPAGRRKNLLKQSLVSQVQILFAGRILTFDTHAAETFAITHAAALQHGNTIGFPDCAIAAIARTHGFAVATRNTRDFRGTGITVINPWDHPAALINPNAG
mgnify:FL=1